MTTAAKKKAAAKRKRARKNTVRAATALKTEGKLKRELTKLAESVEMIRDKYVSKLIGTELEPLADDLEALASRIRGYDQRDDMPRDKDAES